MNLKFLNANNNKNITNNGIKYMTNLKTFYIYGNSKIAE